MLINSRVERVTIGRRLKGVRERAHIGIADAAASLGVQPLAIERWERGAALPSLVEFKAVLELYGVAACDVLFESNPYTLSAEEASELSQHAKGFSATLRVRVDCLLAMLARGKEPVWRKVA